MIKGFKLKTWWTLASRSISAHFIWAKEAVSHHSAESCSAGSWTNASSSCSPGCTVSNMGSLGTSTHVAERSRIYEGINELIHDMLVRSTAGYSILYTGRMIRTQLHTGSVALLTCDRRIITAAVSIYACLSDLTLMPQGLHCGSYLISVCYQGIPNEKKKERTGNQYIAVVAPCWRKIMGRLHNPECAALAWNHGHQPGAAHLVYPVSMKGKWVQSCFFSFSFLKLSTIMLLLLKTMVLNRSP